MKTKRQKAYAALKRIKDLRRVEIIAEAKGEHGVEGEVEVDDDAKLSEGEDNGCYVQAWVWVDFAGTRWDKEA